MHHRDQVMNDLVGSKKESNWDHFGKLMVDMAECKHCKTSISTIASNMKTHLVNCDH